MSWKIEKKEFCIGRFVVVWDRVEAVKWLSFFMGLFVSALFLGGILYLKNINKSVASFIFVCGVLGFFISSSMVKAIIRDNFE